MGEIKKEELMIGDYVHNKRTKDIVWVFEIDGDRNVINNEPDGYCSEKNIDIDDIEPVPLTPEILEKNGFENITQRLESIEQYIHLYELSDNIVLGELPIGFNVCIEKYNGDWDIYEHHIVFTIRYTHELQHTLKLCGIEKTFEL